MIFDKTVKLKDIDPRTYVPPKGIDVSWGYDNGDVYGTFIGGNINSEQYVRDRSDINAALSRLKVIQDTIKDYKTYKKVVPLGPKAIVWHDGKVDKG
jgi:hypothetical protein